MGKMFGTSAHDDDTEVLAEVDPTALKFRRGSCVTAWKTLGAMFPGSLSFSKPVKLDKGPQILGRFRIFSERGKDGAEIVFEAMVLPEGETFEGLKMDLRQKWEKGGSKTFFLWKCPANFYCPAARAALSVTPGICLKGSEDEIPSDPIVRWVVNWILDLSRKRAHIKSAAEWAKYWENPTMARGEKAPYGFVFRTSTQPIPSGPKG